MRSSYFLVLASTAGFAAALACSTGSLTPPTSDKQFDDPCDPGGGSGGGGSLTAVDAGGQAIVLPGAPPGIGFDDLRFSATLSLLLVPAGRTGNMDLFDPSSEAVSTIGGFSSAAAYSGDDTFGVTSADEGNGTVYAVDRTAKTLAVIDPKTKKVVAQTAVAATPGYVRYVATTNDAGTSAGEVWVTEPSQQQIEVFALGSSPSVAPTHSAVIGVGGGPESLAIDAATNTAYTHTGTATVAIDVAGHSIAHQWPNGCTTSRGIAVDPAHGWVMSACQEGRVVVLDGQSGTTLGENDKVGGGVDQVAYDPQSMRLYVPAAAASSVAVLVLGSNGAPTLLGSMQATNDAHCAVTSGNGYVYVCSPSQGALVFEKDPF
jgi:DNA-binding beta-propeller fold protein YncE